jgi:hypothetical protein
MPVLLRDVQRVLSEGGFIRYIWRTGRRELIAANGSSLRIDGRTYQSLLKKHTAGLIRTETGSTENKDLVIEWRKK